MLTIPAGSVFRVITMPVLVTARLPEAATRIRRVSHEPPADPPEDKPAPLHERHPEFAARMQAEAEFDNDAYEAFKAAHGGKDVLDVLAEHDPVFGAILAMNRKREAEFEARYGMTPMQYIEKHDPLAKQRGQKRRTAR